MKVKTWISEIGFKTSADPSPETVAAFNELMKTASEALKHLGDLAKAEAAASGIRAKVTKRTQELQQ